MMTLQKLESTAQCPINGYVYVEIVSNGPRQQYQKPWLCKEETPTWLGLGTKAA